MQWCAYRRRLAANTPDRSDNSIRKKLNSLANSFQSNNVFFIWLFLDSFLLKGTAIGFLISKGNRLPSTRKWRSHQ
jgi:hypothetical protein